jgi:site-specific recombinase XerD
MNPITTFEACAAVPALPAADLEIAKDFARASKATATRRVYQKDFVRFTAWCDHRRLSVIPAAPETVAAFLAAAAARGIKPATIGRRVAAIRYAHKLAGHDDPPTSSEVVKATVQGIRRMLGAAPVRKTPATADKVVAMAALADTDMKGLRDRAILLLGFAGAFRRSLACPVKAVRAWLEASNIATGPLFRPIGKGSRISTDRLADHTVVRVVKASARRVGLDPKLFAGHSLRSGFLTSAAGRGASIFKMMDQSRHRSMDTLRGYVRDAELFRDHAGAGLL